MHFAFLTNGTMIIMFYVRAQKAINTELARKEFFAKVPPEKREYFENLAKVAAWKREEHNAAIKARKKRKTKGAWCPLCADPLVSHRRGLAMNFNPDCLHVYDWDCLAFLRDDRGRTDGITDGWVHFFEKSYSLYEKDKFKYHIYNFPGLSSA